MLNRLILLLAGVLLAGLVGSFFLYVSALALLASLAVAIGLIGTLAIGFWAGSSSSNQTPPSVRKGGTIQVINTPADVPFLPEIPAATMKRETGMRIVASRERTEDLSAAVSNQ